jgi:hypothetical protein
MASEFGRCHLNAAGSTCLLSRIEAEEFKDQHCVNLIVSRPLDGRRIRFCGLSDRSCGKAASKAFAEFLEANTIWSLGLSPENTRSGWACGETIIDAKARAYQELVERDAILMHFLCPSLKSIHVPLKNQSIRAVQLQSVDPKLFVVICGMKFETGQWLIGAGCGKNVASTLQKAYFELLMMKKDWTKNVSTKEPANIEMDASLLEHWNAMKDPEISNRVERIFAHRGQDELRFAVSEDRVFLKNEREYSDKHFVVGCGHPELLPLTFSSMWIATEELGRKILNSRGLTVEAWLTHPML